MRTCDVCGGTLHRGQCRECGGIDALAPASTNPGVPRICPLDGTHLRADGWCHTGDGFPLGLAHPPDVCESCRHPLRWDGDCPSCLPSGFKPGHRYDYDPYTPGVPTSAHWRIAEHGPLPIAAPTPDQRATLDHAFAPAPPTRKPLPILPRIREFARL